MIEILKKPHPFIFNVYSVVVPSFITLLIIVFLAPFQFQEMDLGPRVVYALAISMLVALGIILAVNSLKRIFPNIVSEDKWTLGKELGLILFILLLIVFLISIALLFIQARHVSFFALIFKTASITFTISILPIVVLVLFEQYRYQKIQLKKALALTETLKISNKKLLANQVRKEHLEEPILIKSENQDAVLRLNSRDLICLKSDGNYVEVFFLNDRQTQKKVIRNRLKVIEGELSDSAFFRCHNRFVVNGTHIQSVEGNARNLILRLQGIAEGIPVSRAKAKSIDAFLKQLQ